METDNVTGDLRLWSRKMIIELIERYKSHICLWKVNTHEYKNKYMKSAAYKDLVLFCVERGFPEATKDFIRRKIQSLRGSFRKEVRKTRQFARAGQKYQSTLWYYNHLLFTKGEDNEEDDKNQSEEDEDTCQSNEEAFEDLDADEDKYIEEKPSVATVHISNREDVLLTKKRKRTTEDCLQPEFFDVGQELPKNKELSEFELTGMNIAKKLARMDATQAIYAEYIINNVIRKGLLKKLIDETDLCDNMCSKRILTVSHLPSQSSSNSFN